MNVLVVGGMSGLGRAIAVEALRRGFRTTVTGRGEMSALAALDLDGARTIKLNIVEANDEDLKLMFEAVAECDTLLWVAGAWLRKPLHECDDEMIGEQILLHLMVPILMIHKILQCRIEARRPITIVMISSSSSWKVRADGQAVYGAVQAGKAQFARNLHAELQTTLPGSRVFLVCPGGIKGTKFFEGSDVDTSKFMDPREVAEKIWWTLTKDPETSELHLKQGLHGIIKHCGPAMPG